MEVFHTYTCYFAWYERIKKDCDPEKNATGNDGAAAGGGGDGATSAVAGNSSIGDGKKASS